MPDPTTPTFKLRDRVKVNHTAWVGRIYTLRGPLGPGGAQLYGVRVQRAKAMGARPKPMFVTVTADQLELLPHPPATPSQPSAVG